MSENNLPKAALLMCCLVAVAVIGWEVSWRSRGLQISYDDGPALWAHAFKSIYQPAENAVVFIGSSRMKYDLDIPTWEQATGCQAVQLAMEGTCARPVLQRLADDPSFKGRLVIDATEGLFFSNSPFNLEKPTENIRYVKEETPSQRAGFFLNGALESQFVFLDKGNLSLHAALEALQIPNRPKVFNEPLFPLDFQQVTFDRQMYMTDRFLRDTTLQNRVKNIWFGFEQMAKGRPPMAEATLDSIFGTIKQAVATIKARGGVVVFIRPPSSGILLEHEKEKFPREKYWQRLLTETGCPGIHFADYSATDHFECPELSHLSRADASRYTLQLIQILEKEQGWTFCKTALPPTAVH